jgi:hypothetical protein
MAPNEKLNKIACPALNLEPYFTRYWHSIVLLLKKWRGNFGQMETKCLEWKRENVWSKESKSSAKICRSPK